MDTNRAADRLKLKDFSSYFLLILVALLLRCAHVEVPPGGPEDKQAPRVLAVYPPPDSAGLSRDLKVQLEFNEWPARSSSANLIIAPPLPRKLKVKQSGPLLTVTSESKLDTNTTYVITILPSLRDLRGIALEKDFQLRFSTGLSIDSGKIKALVQSGDWNKPLVNAYVGLYPLDKRNQLGYLTQKKSGTVEPDSFPHPGKERPMYLVACDSLGTCQMEGIRPGSYAALAFSDINLSRRIELGTEALAIGSQRVTIDTSASMLPFFLYPLDTTMLVPKTATLHRLHSRTDSSQAKGSRSKGPIGRGLNEGPGTLRLEFNQVPDWEKNKSLTQILLFSSDTNKALNLGSPVALDDPLNWSFYVNTIPDDSVFQLRFGELVSQSGNPLDPRYQRFGVKLDSALDTAAFQFKLRRKADQSGLSKLLPANGVIYKDSLLLFSNRDLNDSLFGLIENDLRAKIDTQKVRIQSQAVDHRHIQLLFIEKPKSGILSLYFPGDTVQLDSSKRSDPPKLFQEVFKMRISKDSMMGTLTFQNSVELKDYNFVLKTFLGERTLLHPAPKTQQWEWKNLPYGKYSLEFWKDDDNNQRWNMGDWRTWSAQEKRGYWRDTISVGEADQNASPLQINWPAETGRNLTTNENDSLTESDSTSLIKD